MFVILVEPIGKVNLTNIIRGGYIMTDNQYTRKEVVCFINRVYCDSEEKDCGKCIFEEEEFQKEQWRKECVSK